MIVNESESWTLCCDGMCQNPGGVCRDCCLVMRSGRDNERDESVRRHGREVEGTDVPCTDHAVKLPMSL